MKMHVRGSRGCRRDANVLHAWAGAAEAFAGDADADEGLAEDLRRVRLASTAPGPAPVPGPQHVALTKDAGAHGMVCLRNHSIDSDSKIM